ncbi:hypothetical protein GS399_17130 [Pedobacter sp. HMF7647]|uniref:Glycosyl transferase n=1 Tax=Hufsiella arboris TaxID=2695275 RepID=A0A7K1YFE1_9SPHI|nr:hypothetical protein [Hufsiella arboris]MXV52699.1 hypothetical protein [Hufsiella arboris]
MKKIEKFIAENPDRTFFLLIILALPAFFYNLGLQPLFADEPTRANVALEMILSKRFSVPTVGGEYYYNKPPVYNWILASLYLLTGSFSEFVTRLPAVVPMFLFAVTIYYSTAHFLKNNTTALLAGIFFLVNGRMLFYDSMLGHIDIFYSWLTYISFMLMFYFSQRNEWFKLFFFTYLITAITFLSKGLPSVVFQGLSLIALTTYTGNFKKLFSWQHIIGGSVFVLIVGGYFYNYWLHNPNVVGYLDTMWHQSSQRTATKFSFWNNVMYVLKFPFEHLVHLLPVTLLIVYCFNREFIKRLFETPFLKFVVILLLANIWIYWLSPMTRPRYLLMLYPLIFVVISDAYVTFQGRLPRFNTILFYFVATACSIVTIILPIILMLETPQNVDYLVLKACIVFLLMAALCLLIWQIPSQKIVLFFAFLVILRLGFSFFVIPERNQDAKKYRAIAIEMGAISKGKPFYFYSYHPHVEDIPFYDRLIFYIERSRMQMLKIVDQDNMSGYYLTFDKNLENPSAALVKEYEDGLKLFFVK